jgi:hypothetical protein
MKQLILILATCLIVFGCGGAKPAFKELTDLPQKRGAVYVYMSKRDNIAQKAELSLDNAEGIGAPVGNLLNGNHIAFAAPLGENLIKIGDKTAVSLYVEEGESYYVKITSTKPFFSFIYKMQSKDPTAGFAEIQDTKPQPTVLY